MLFLFFPYHKKWKPYSIAVRTCVLIRTAENDNLRVVMYVCVHKKVNMLHVCTLHILPFLQNFHTIRPWAKKYGKKPQAYVCTTPRTGRAHGVAFNDGPCLHYIVAQGPLAQTTNGQSSNPFDVTAQVLETAACAAIQSTAKLLPNRPRGGSDSNLC